MEVIVTVHIITLETLKQGRSKTFIVTALTIKKNCCHKVTGKIDIWCIATTTRAHSNIPKVCN